MDLLDFLIKFNFAQHTEPNQTNSNVNYEYTENNEEANLLI